MKKIILIIIVFTSIVGSAIAQDIVPVVQAGHSGSILFVEWDPTSRYIASIDINNELVINDLISGKMFYRIKIPGGSVAKALSFEDENSIIVATYGQSYKFDMKSLELENTSSSIPQKEIGDGLKINGAVLRKGSKSLFNRDAYTHFTFAANSIDGKYIVAGDERGCVYFCSEKLKLKDFDKTHFLSVNDIDFSSDGQFVAIASSDRSISICSLPEFKFEKRVIPRSFNISAIDSHPEDSILVFGDELGYVYQLKFEGDKVSVQGVNGHNGTVNDICFSPNSAVVGTAGSDNKAAIVDFENKKVLQYFRLHPQASKVKQTFNIKSIQEKVTNEDSDKLWFDENVYAVAISDDGKTIAYSGGKWGLTNPVLKVSSISNLNINGAKEERKEKKPEIGLMSKNNEHIFRQLYFDGDKQFYGFGEQENKAIKFNTTITGYSEKDDVNLSYVFNTNKPNNHLIVKAVYDKSPDSEYLIKLDPKTGDTYTCRGFEIQRKTGGKTITYKGHRGYINDIEIITGKNYLISSAEDASMNIWNLETGEKLLSVYVVDMGKLIFITPDNYYMSTGDALTGLGFNFDGKVFPAEQFDIKYNRPDYVIESFGYFEQDMVDLYHKAYLKRISKLGFTEEMLEGKINLPELKINNLNEIPLKTTTQNISVDLSMSDKNYDLDRVNVYVNDVPLFGTKGMSLKDDKSGNIKKKIDIPLSKGDNIIYISCLNEKGIESLKEELSVHYESSDNTKPNLYLISLAVAEYEDSQYNLRYTINDGEGFIKLFTENNSKNFNHIYVDTFYNASCTRENVLAVKDKLMNTDVDDYVYVHIAGHGLLDDNLDFYFATADINFAHPSRNGLKYDEIEGLLDGIPARNKLLLMDACHSGEVDKDDDFAVNTVTDGDDTRGVTMFSTKATGTPKTGLQNSFELMKLLFADLKKGTGTVVISAASGGGYALENEDIENGIFTYCLIEAVSKGRADVNEDKEITVSELRTYIFDGVKRLSGGKQQPTSRSENLMNDFKIK